MLQAVAARRGRTGPVLCCRRGVVNAQVAPFPQTMRSRRKMRRADLAARGRGAPAHPATRRRFPMNGKIVAKSGS